MNLSISPTAQKEVPGEGRKQTFLALLLKIQNKIHYRSVILDNITALQRSEGVSQSSDFQAVPGDVVRFVTALS